MSEFLIRFTHLLFVIIKLRYFDIYKFINCIILLKTTNDFLLFMCVPFEFRCMITLYSQDIRDSSTCTLIISESLNSSALNQQFLALVQKTIQSIIFVPSHYSKSLSHGEAMMDTFSLSEDALFSVTKMLIRTNNVIKRDADDFLYKTDTLISLQGNSSMQ